MRALWIAALGAGVLLAAPARGQEVERKTFMSFSDDIVQGDLGDAFVEGKFRLGTKRMRRANRVAAELLRQRMKRRRPSELRLIRQAGAADVVVIKGAYDRVQEVLRAVKIKHVVIPPRLLARVPLMSLQTVMVNCPGHLSAAARKKLRRFVKTGGYLVTTDWALTTVQRMFPGTIARGSRNTKNDVVGVHVHPGASALVGHLAGVGKARPRWWLEAASYPIRVLNRKKVQVLVSSKEMRGKYGHGAVAVTFRHDDGRVLHMTSHFYLQQARLRSASERARGGAYARQLGIKGKSLRRLLRKGLGSARAGEVNSAYSMQQVTANVLVDKARSNKKLLKQFTSKAARAFHLRARPDAGAAAGGLVKKGYLLKVLKRAGAWIRVRNLFAREGWTRAGNVK